MKKEGFCHYCSEKKKLIEAHIIPKFCIIDLCEDKKNPELVVLNNCKLPFKSKTRIGWRDNSILCNYCDNKLGVYDNYAKKFLFNPDFEKFYIKKLNCFSFPYESFDYLKLKKFFVSVLWRASISSITPFKRINLGEKYNKLAMCFLKEEIDDSEDLFSVILIKHNEGIIMDPYKQRFENVNFYRFFLGKYQFVIKVDQQRMPSCFDDLFLQKNRNFFVLNLNFRDSKDFFVSKNLVKNFLQQTTC